MNLVLGLLVHFLWNRSSNGCFLTLKKDESFISKIFRRNDKIISSTDKLFIVSLNKVNLAVIWQQLVNALWVRLHFQLLCKQNVPKKQFMDDEWEKNDFNCAQVICVSLGFKFTEISAWMRRNQRLHCRRKPSRRMIHWSASWKD